jgi:oligopeptide/dipeptide ABC transporter ATP-binding protein
MFENRPEYDRNLIDVVNLKKYFPIRGGLLKRAVGSVKAVDDVTFFIKRGETLGLVGESGCGKTTVGRAIVMLTPPTAGYVFLETPKEVVKDFRTLLDLKESAKKGKFTAGKAVKMLEAVDRLLSAQACEIRDEKKKNLCKDAGKLLRLLEKHDENRNLGGKEDDVLKLVDQAIEEVSQRYCINHKRKGEVKRLRSRVQFVFQDPFSSLDPKMLVKDIVAEPLVAQIRHRRSTPVKQTAQDTRKGVLTKRPRRATREEVHNTIVKLLEKVGLNLEHMYRFPHEFSGGQRQRIGIARALSVNPDFVVLDEPTSALDVSVQAQILNMLNQLQKDFGLTFLFISHDLSTIRYMCDRVAVMYLGKVVEYAEKHELFNKPTHPYTEALLSVIPVPDPDLKRDRIILPGDVPSPANPPSGCRFHTRCPLVIDICHTVEPPLTDRGNEHFVACHVR